MNPNHPDVVIGGAVDGRVPYPGSKKTPCERCLSLVWVSPRSQRLMSKRGLKAYCFRCLDVLVAERRATGDEPEFRFPWEEDPS